MRSHCILRNHVQLRIRILVVTLDVYSLHWSFLQQSGARFAQHHAAQGWIACKRAKGFAQECFIYKLILYDLVNRLIRLSSHKLNYLIGAGALVLYIDVCFFVIPSTDQLSATIYCNVCMSLIIHCVKQYRKGIMKKIFEFIRPGL